MLPPRGAAFFKNGWCILRARGVRNRGLKLRFSYRVERCIERTAPHLGQRVRARPIGIQLPS